MAVHTPCLEDAVGVALLARATHVVHDLVVAVLLERRPQARTQLVEGLVPRDALPGAAAALTDALHREHHPLGVIDLVEGGGTLRADAAAAKNQVPRD